MDGGRDGAREGGQVDGSLPAGAPWTDSRSRFQPLKQHMSRLISPLYLSEEGPAGRLQNPPPWAFKNKSPWFPVGCRSGGGIIVFEV